MPRCTVLTAWEMILLCHAPGRDDGAGALCRCSASYSPSPTLSACRSSHACSSLTGISLRRPRRTSRTSGSICARHVSQDTPSASHACSTLSAKAGVLRFWAVGVAAVRDEIEAIAVTDPDPPRTAIALRREKEVRARHWGALWEGPRRASRAAGQAPDACASHQSVARTTENSPTTRAGSQTGSRPAPAYPSGCSPLARPGGQRPG